MPKTPEDASVVPVGSIKKGDLVHLYGEVTFGWHEVVENQRVSEGMHVRLKDLDEPITLRSMFYRVRR